METVVPPERKVIRLSKKKLGWLVVIVVVLLLLVWAVINVVGRTYGIDQNSRLRGSQVPLVESPFGGESAPAVMPAYYPNNGSPDITDTREFLKTSYSAELKTRDVRGVTRNVKGAIKDAEGRIDNISTSDRSAYISFVVPETKFEDFRDEIESLTQHKLYSERVSSENLLGQKQSIERQQVDQNSSLASLQQQEKTESQQHALNASSLKRDLGSVQAQLFSVRAQLASTTLAADQRTLLLSEESTLLQREASAKKRLDKENSTYVARHNDLLSWISNAQNALNNLDAQNTDLLNNVATVSGSISVTWVSYWDILKIYSPIHPTWIIIILILVLWFLLRKRLPKIEWV